MLILKWSKRDAMWEEKFSMYLDYINTYKTPLVEKGLEGYNSALDAWCKRQRDLYKNGELSEKRILRLNNIGFVWNTLDYKWMFIYNELKDFIYSCGETTYTYRLLLKYTGDMQLSHWISSQKEAFKKGVLSDKRLKLLLDIGIEFN